MIQNWTLGAVGEAPTDPGAGPRSQQPFFFRAPAQPLLLMAQRRHTQLLCRQGTHSVSLAWGQSLQLSHTQRALCLVGCHEVVGGKAQVITGGILISHFNSLHGPHLDSQVDDMDMDLDKEFLQDLKELKVLVADKDLLDLHKR